MSDDPVAAHRAYAPLELGWAVLTVSSSRTLGDDRGGDRAAALIAAAGHSRIARHLVPDDRAAIADAARELLAQSEVDVLVVTGGTGISPSDGTPEAIAPLLERRLDGFGELFRALSFAEIGAAAMLSRALGGVAAGKAIFVVPGSPAAVELALSRLILPEAGHLLGELRRAR